VPALPPRHHLGCVKGGFFPANGDGGQGGAVRVPLADGTLVTVPGSGHSDEMVASLLTLSDVMATGHDAAVCADVRQGGAVAVVGDGAVGLCGVLAAKRLGAERIIALSRNPGRQEVARAARRPYGPISPSSSTTCWTVASTPVASSTTRPISKESPTPTRPWTSAARSSRSSA
jgi:hypothetical protein